MMNNSKTRLVLKNVVCDLLIFALQFSSVSNGFAGSGAEFSDADLLKKSQISYRAEGGFSGVQSYGVILSCVNGKVSVMKSIVDPRLQADRATMREIGTMDSKVYIQLWNNLDRQAMFKIKDAPLPKMDIHDEFTVHFYAAVGDNYHNFAVYGISRPEAARYFALQNLIDNSVAMKGLWTRHTGLAKNLDSSTEEEN